MPTQWADRCHSRRTVSAPLAVCRRRLACSASSRPFNTATDWLFEINDRGWPREYGLLSTSERVRRWLLRALRGAVRRDYGAEGIDRQQGPQRSGPSLWIIPTPPAVSGRAQERRAAGADRIERNARAPRQCVSSGSVGRADRRLKFAGPLQLPHRSNTRQHRRFARDARLFVQRDR